MPETLVIGLSYGITFVRINCLVHNEGSWEIITNYSGMVWKKIKSIGLAIALSFK